MNDVGKFAVEPGIEMPDVQERTSKYPFKSMQIGDSFAMTRDELPAVRNAAGSFSKRHGSQYAFRLIGTDVWRCWRIK
jgi:hypothetical protein